MAEIKHVSDGAFESEVLRSTHPVLVDFTATWCNPCKMLDPLVKQLAQEWEGKVIILKMDVDDNPDVAMQFQVMGVPTLILFINGAPVARTSGYQPKDKLSAKFLPHLN